MDPNETLRVLREAMQTYIRGEATRDREVMADAASDLHTHTEALDTWLSQGGFLPDAWNGSVDRLNDYGRRKFGDAWWPGEEDPE